MSSPRAMFKKIFDHDAIIVVVKGFWKTGKTNVALLIMETLLELGIIELFATNIKIKETENIKYICDLPTLKEFHYDFILLDINMLGKNGAEITKNILEARPESKIIIITTLPVAALAKDALASGANSIVAKPLTLMKILNLIKTNNMEEN